MRAYPTNGEQAIRGEIKRHFSEFFMPIRRDWNAMGPPLPAWFKLRLKYIDPQLTVQFIPPDNMAGGGVNHAQYPEGVWAICRRLKKTGLLAKRWVYSLVDTKGRYAPPNMGLIRMIQRARNLWRRGKIHELEDVFDDVAKKANKAKIAADKERLVNLVANAMRRYGIVSITSPHVFVPRGPD